MNSQMPVFLHGSSNSGHNMVSQHVSCVGVALIEGQFPLFHGLSDSIAMAN
jgi:hypothetical protein